MGLPAVAVVWAKLVVRNKTVGLRPLLVPINDGQHLYPGITAKLLPHRGTAHPVNHTITSFSHYRLPHSALLGSLETSPNEGFMLGLSLWRINTGAIALASAALPILKIQTTIAALYSMRRKVSQPGGQMVPIIHFRTQQIPVLTSIAQTYVLDAFREYTTSFFSNSNNDMGTRMVLSASFKAVMMQLSKASNLALSERCGAQGLLDYNQFTVLFVSLFPSIV